MMCTFISVLGGFCFIMCAFYLVQDRDKAEGFTRTHDDESSLLGSVASENYPPAVAENQAVEDDDDDKLIDVDPVAPTPSERETLVVPVDVHSESPVQEEHNNHVI